MGCEAPGALIRHNRGMQGDTPGAGMGFAVLGPLDVRRDGRPVEVGGQRVLVTAHPLRERPYALYGSGRRVEALAAYEEARSTFAGRLGADPSPRRPNSVSRC